MEKVCMYFFVCAQKYIYIKCLIQMCIYLFLHMYVIHMYGYAMCRSMLTCVCRDVCMRACGGQRLTMCLP